MPDQPMRHDFLDWLRVLAIAVLVFFHTGMLFVGWGWHIENADVIEALRRPMEISHRLRMPLLFVIAGAGMWFALRRRSGGQVVRERSLRLLVPLLFGMLLIVPPQIYFERLFRGQWDGGYFQFFTERVLQLQAYPQGDFSWHHLWFIAYLYVYVLLLLPVLLWWQRKAIQLQPGVWLYALGVPLAINEAVLKPLFPETHTLTSDWYTFNHYLLLTLYGFLLASMHNAWDWLMMQRRLALGGAVSLLAIGLPLIDAGIIRHDTALEATLANNFTWLSLMAFFGYGRRHLSFSNRLLQWGRDASYPIYILHQTIIITLGYWVIQQPWNPWVKYGVVLLVTILTCVLIYDAVVRRFTLTRLIFGMKSNTAPVSQPHTANTHEPVNRTAGRT